MVGSLASNVEGYDIVCSVQGYTAGYNSAKRLATFLEHKGTTAGWKGTFPYDKLIQFLVWMVTEPGKAFIMGGTYRIPVLVKLLDRTFVQDLKRDGTFNEASFEREYRFVFFKYCELLETPQSFLNYNIKMK